MAAPNIVSVGTITGKTAVQAIGTSPAAIVTNSGSSGKVFKVNTLLIANVDGTVAASVTVDLYRSSTAYHLVKTIQVFADSTLEVINNNSIYLEEGDSLRLTASAASDLEGICSYEEISE
tara:strand:- start:92 stop:451 length:360 start_codon:yes stop_codon:yes gene_type:complete